MSLLIGLAPAMAFGIADEVQTSRWQATLISVVAGKLKFHVEPGPSDAIRFPATGPYDARLGYDRLPDFIACSSIHSIASVHNSVGAHA